MENTGGSRPQAPLDGRKVASTAGEAEDRTLTLSTRDHGNHISKRTRTCEPPTLAESFRPVEKALIEKAKSLRLHIPPRKLRSISPEPAPKTDIETLLHHGLQQSELSGKNQTLTQSSVPSQFLELTGSTTSVSFLINELSNAKKFEQGSARIQNIYASLQFGPPRLPSFVESGIGNAARPVETIDPSASPPSSVSEDHHMSGVEEYAPNPSTPIKIVSGSSKNENSQKPPVPRSATSKTSTVSPVVRRKRTIRYPGIPYVLLPFGIHAPPSPDESKRKKGEKATSGNDSLVGSNSLTAQGPELAVCEGGLQGQVVGASFAKQASTSDPINRYSQDSSETQSPAPNLPYCSPYTSPVQSQAGSPVKSLSPSMSGPSANPTQVPSMASQPQLPVESASQTTTPAPQNNSVYIKRLTDSPSLKYPFEFYPPNRDLGLAPYNDHGVITLIEAGYDCKVYSPSNFLQLVAKSPDPKPLVTAWKAKNPPQPPPEFVGTGMSLKDSSSAQSLTLRIDRIPEKYLMFIRGIYSIKLLAINLADLNRCIGPAPHHPLEKAVAEFANHSLYKTGFTLSCKAMQTAWTVGCHHAARTAHRAQDALAPTGPQAPILAVPQAPPAVPGAVIPQNGDTQPRSTPRERNPLSAKFDVVKTENARLTKENLALHTQLAAAQAQIAHLSQDRDFYKLQVVTSTPIQGKPYIIPEAGRLYIFGQLLDANNPQFICQRTLQRGMGPQKAGEVCGHVNKFYVMAKESSFVWFDREKCAACKQVQRGFVFVEPARAGAEMAFKRMMGKVGRKALGVSMMSTWPVELGEMGVDMTPQPPVSVVGFGGFGGAFAAPGGFPPAPVGFVAPNPAWKAPASSGLFLSESRAVPTGSLTMPSVSGGGGSGSVSVDDPEIDALFEEDTEMEDELESALRAALAGN